MPLDGISPTALVLPLFNFILPAVKASYEIASVPSETTDYLKTITQVLADLETARALRKQKSSILDHEALVRVDKVIYNTEAAMKGLEVLVERARVDMSVHFNQVGARSRMMWVFRDSTKVGAAMARLGIASQSLHAETAMMRNLRSWPGGFEHDDNDGKWPRYSSAGSGNDPDNGPAPPSYLQATCEAMNERRSWNERQNTMNRRRPGSILRQSEATSSFGSAPPTRQMNSSGASPASFTDIARFIKENEEMLASSAPGGTATASYDTFNPAVMVDSSHSYMNELEADFPLPSLPHQGPSSGVLSTSPWALAVPDRSSLVSKRTSLQLSAPSIPAAKVAPDMRQKSRSSAPSRPEQSAGRHRSQTLMSSSAVMETMTTIPGHQKPIVLRWREPQDEVVGSSSTNHEADLVDLDPIDEFSTVSASTASSDLLQMDTAPGAGVERTETTRRIRPARIQNQSNVGTVASEVSQAPRTRARSAHRSGSMRERHPRLDWQGEQLLDSINGLRLS